MLLLLSSFALTTSEAPVGTTSLGSMRCLELFQEAETMTRRALDDRARSSQGRDWLNRKGISLLQSSLKRAAEIFDHHHLMHIDGGREGGIREPKDHGFPLR